MGIGTAALGGMYAKVQDSDARGVIESSLELGINFFDTAPHYGKGASERRLGSLLNSYPRDSYLISSKVGRLLLPVAKSDDLYFADADNQVERHFDFSASGVEQSLTASLERLQIESIDIVFIHDPDDYADIAITEAYPALEKMRDQGLIKAIGVGMNQCAIPTRFVNETDIDVVLIAGRYTLLDQSAESDLLPAALAKGVSVIAAGVFNSGILANPIKGAHYDYELASDELINRAKKLADLLTSHGISLTSAALQFPLRHSAVTSILVGARNAQEVRENVEAFNTPIPESIWSALELLISEG
jgi:D-threo-aldose 1-dehydrogenase